MRGRIVKYRKAHGQVLLRPFRQLWRILAPRLDRLIQQALRLIPVRRIEDGANAACHRQTLIKAGDIGLRILLQVKLATLPGNTGEHRAPRRFQAGMIGG